MLFHFQRAFHVLRSEKRCHALCTAGSKQHKSTNVCAPGSPPSLTPLSWKKTATKLLKYFTFLVLNIKSFGLCNAKIGMKRREENRIGAQFRLSLNLHLSHTIVQIFSNISQCFCLCNKNKWGPMQCYFKIIYILL